MPRPASLVFALIATVACAGLPASARPAASSAARSVPVTLAVGDTLELASVAAVQFGATQVAACETSGAAVAGVSDARTVAARGVGRAAVRCLGVVDSGRDLPTTFSEQHPTRRSWVRFALDVAVVTGDTTNGGRP